MATITHRVTTTDTGNTPNTSANFSFASGDLLVVYVSVEASVEATKTLTPANITGVSSFYQVNRAPFRSSADSLYLYVAEQKCTGAGTTGTVTIESGTDAGAGSIISVYTVAGLPDIVYNPSPVSNTGSAAVVKSAAQGNKAAGAPAPAASFTTTCATSSPMLIGLANATNPGGMTSPAAPFGLSQNVGYTTGAVTGMNTALANSGFTGDTITWGSNSASISATIGVEINNQTIYNDSPQGTVVVAGSKSEVYHPPSGVTARRFDSAASDFVKCSIGSSNLTGALTQAMLVKKTADGSAGSGSILVNHTSAGAGATFFGFNSSNQVYWGTSIAALRTSTITVTTADRWCLVVVSKATASSTPRLHILKSGGSWQHEDLSSTSGNPSSQAGGSVQFCQVENLSSWASADLAVAAEWNVALNDAQAAELSTNSSTQDFLNESGGAPVGLWQFNQAAVGTPVTDITGNGANESSRSGTTVFSDGPDGWNYVTVHNDNPIGVVVVAGTRSESYVPAAGPSYNDNPVGRVVLTGARADNKIGSDSRSGVVVVTGTRAESYVYPTATRSGTVVVTGSRAEAKLGSDARSGVLVVTGTKAEARSAADSPSGTVVLSGTRTESKSAADTRSGVLVLTGTRVDSFIGPTNYNDVCSGTVVLGGTRSEQKLHSQNVAGGVRLRGALTRARQFNTAQQDTDHWIDLSIGACNLTGAFTIAKLWNQPEFSTHQPDYTVCHVTGTGANVSDFKINFSENGNEFPPGGSLQMFTVGSSAADYCGGPGTQGSGNTHPEMRTAGYLDGWVIHVISKPAGLEIPRYHIFKDGTWSHGDGFEPQADAPSQAGGFIRLLKFQTPSGFNAFQGMFALLGEWNGQALNDSQVEELSVHGGSRDWLQNSAGAPAGLWQFNQADVSTPVVDITGNGADQQSITGTWVVMDGPGWQFETVYNDEVSGSVIVTGSRTESFIGPTNYTDSCSGTLVLTGTAAQSLSHTSSRSGVVVVGGTCADSYVPAGAVTYDDVATGTIVLAGTKLEAKSAADTRSGTTVVTGTRTESYNVAGVYTDSPSGRVIVAGTKAEAHIENPRPSGTLVITGTRTEAYSHSASRSGTVVVAGTRTEFTGKEYTDSRSGNLIVTGTRTQDLSRVETPYGSIYISGRVTESVSYVTALLGRVVVTGSASEQYVPSGAAFHYPVGGLIIAGTLEELHNRWDWVDGERWPADSDARWGEDVGERWNVDSVV